MQTAGLFNLLAMVLAEAYNFHVHNLNEKDPDRQGAFMCVLFGIIMIYSGSVIIHLGPTLIGGHFQFNDDIGNCLFAYGEIKVRMWQKLPGHQFVSVIQVLELLTSLSFLLVQ